jgi:hypothetical protein
MTDTCRSERNMYDGSSPEDVWRIVGPGCQQRSLGLVIDENDSWNKGNRRAAFFIHYC